MKVKDLSYSQAVEEGGRHATQGAMWEDREGSWLNQAGGELREAEDGGQVPL